MFRRLHFFLSLVLLGLPVYAQDPEVEKTLKTISKNFYDPLEEGVLEYQHTAEFSIDKPFPVSVSGEVKRKKEGEGSFKITQIDPPELEAFIKPFEKQFIQQLEKIALPNFVNLFRNFELKMVQNEKEAIILAGKAKNGENRAIKIFVKSGFVERFELLMVMENPRDPENPRKIQTVQDFSYKEFEGVKVISQMKLTTELGEVIANFEYTKVEGYIFPKEVTTKVGPLETSYSYGDYELVVETGDF
ncbi:MAG: hypothetical protein AABZ60_06100 [Planctomycetota bacterium]